MSKNQLNQLIDHYKSTYTVPKHPKTCPECGNIVKVYHMNEWDAVFMCSRESCLWPLRTHRAEEIFGKSDVETYVKINVEKDKKSSATSGQTSYSLDFSFQYIEETEKDVISPLKSDDNSRKTKDQINQEEIIVKRKLVETPPLTPSSGTVIDRNLKWENSRKIEYKMLRIKI